MATDVQILGAAREVAAALAAKNDADQAKIAADQAQFIAATQANEALKRLQQAEGRLLTLSRSKPIEPAAGGFVLNPLPPEPAVTVPSELEPEFGLPKQSTSSNRKPAPDPEKPARLRGKD